MTVADELVAAGMLVGISGCDYSKAVRFKKGLCDGHADASRFATELLLRIM